LAVCNGCCSAINSCCTGCAKVFESCCTCIADICNGCAEFICNPERPFPTFVCYAFFATFVPGIVGLVIAFMNLEGIDVCRDPLIWLFVMAVVNILHLSFSFYAYYMYTKMTQLGKGNAFSRACKFMAYDWGMCAYYLILIFSIAWSVVGFVWATPPCADEVVKTIIALGVINILYVILSAFIGLCTVCCDCCWDRGAPTTT